MKNKEKKFMFFKKYKVERKKDAGVIIEVWSYIFSKKYKIR